MPTAILLPGTEILWQHICTHWEGWQKGNGDTLTCRLSMPFTYVLDRFNAFWEEFIERESEDDGTVPPDGTYAELNSLGYPSLEMMLVRHPLLFASVIKHGLQTEFAGYVLRSPGEVEKGAPRFFLESMTSVAVVDEYVVLVGECATFWRR
jgi:hypothetical protein